MIANFYFVTAGTETNDLQQESQLSHIPGQESLVMLAKLKLKN